VVGGLENAFMNHSLSEYAQEKASRPTPAQEAEVHPSALNCWALGSRVSGLGFGDRPAPRRACPFIPRQAYSSRGGPIYPEAGLSISRRASLPEPLALGVNGSGESQQTHSGAGCGGTPLNPKILGVRVSGFKLGRG